MPFVIKHLKRRGGRGETPAHCGVRPAIGDDRPQRVAQLAGSNLVEVGRSGIGGAILVVRTTSPTA
jgi:hypothetical protein